MGREQIDFFRRHFDRGRGIAIMETFSKLCIIYFLIDCSVYLFFGVIELAVLVWFLRWLFKEEKEK